MNYRSFATAVSRANVSQYVTFAIAIAMAMAAWWALSLDLWGFDGPGAGLFPLVSAVVALGAAIASIFLPEVPGLSLAPDDTNATVDPAERTTFLVYGLCMVLISIGGFLLGFTSTILVTTFIIQRFAERKSNIASLFFAVCLSLSGFLVFDIFLGVDLPQGPVEQVVDQLING